MADQYFKKDGDDYVEVKEPLHTQADMEYNLNKRMERESKKYADYDDLKEKAGKVDTISKEFEDKLKAKDTEIGELNGKVKTAELATDKVKIINEFGLKDELHEFVTGDTVDEMRERAEKLAKGAGGGKVVIKKGGKPDDKASDSKNIAKNLFGPKE